MRIVFCGSGAFGVPALRALSSAEDLRPTLVVSQPDRPAGRSRALAAAPLKAEADRLGLPTFQPEKLNAPEALARLAAEKPDALVVVAYGQILRKAALALPKFGCVNLHGSLLPRHRGASPIQAALLSGDVETGVTAMVMDEGLDTGPILDFLTAPVLKDDDASTLHDRVALRGGELLPRVLRAYVAGELKPRPQPSDGATVCRTLTRDDARVDWTRPAVELERLVRAMRPWPGAWTRVDREADGFDLGVVAAEIAEASDVAAPSDAAPGAVLADRRGAPVVATGEGFLRLLSVKPSGRGAMPGPSLFHGRKLAVGDRLA
jgi:methionyl-tRNA formyltransferase